MTVDSDYGCVVSFPRDGLQKPHRLCRMEEPHEMGPIDGSIVAKPSRLSEVPKKMTGLPDPSSLTIDKQIAGEPIWPP